MHASLGNTNNGVYSYAYMLVTSYIMAFIVSSFCSTRSIYLLINNVLDHTKALTPAVIAYAISGRSQRFNFILKKHRNSVNNWEISYKPHMAYTKP